MSQTAEIDNAIARILDESPPVSTTTEVGELAVVETYTLTCYDCAGSGYVHDPDADDGEHRQRCTECDGEGSRTFTVHDPPFTREEWLELTTTSTSEVAFGLLAQSMRGAA